MAMQLPVIDAGDGVGEVDDFLFRKMGTEALEDIVGRVCLRNQRESFGPRSRAARSFGVKRGFAPGIQFIEALLERFTGGASLFGMHVEAIGATIDLGGAHPDEMEQFLVDAAGSEIAFDGEQRVPAVRRATFWYSMRAFMLAGLSRKN